MHKIQLLTIRSSSKENKVSKPTNYDLMYSSSSQKATVSLRLLFSVAHSNEQCRKINCARTQNP